MKRRPSEIIGVGLLTGATLLGTSACSNSIVAESPGAAVAHNKYTTDIDAQAQKIITLSGHTALSVVSKSKRRAFGFGLLTAPRTEGTEAIIVSVETSNNKPEADKTDYIDYSQTEANGASFNLTFKPNPNGTWTSTCSDHEAGLSENDQRIVLSGNAVAYHSKADADAVLSDEIDSLTTLIDNTDNNPYKDEPVKPAPDICEINLG